jgi:phosphonate transport system ATP-binding protein
MCGGGLKGSKALTPIFQLEHVSVRYGEVAALTDVTFSVHSGECVALIGPSGAGKSTLLSLLNGSLFATDGRVFVLGQDLATLRPEALRRIQRQIGTVYQQFHLVGNLKVVHNVNFGRLGYWSFPKALFSLFRPLEMERALAALQQVGIPEKIHARADQLSGGQQQRVALARVLVQDPLAILADEPISSLDPKRSIDVMDMLRALTMNNTKTLVASVHAVEYVFTHFSRAIGLRGGRLIFDTPVSALSREMVQDLYYNE